VEEARHAKLSHLSPEANRGLGEGSLVSLDLRSLPDKINLVGLEPLGLLEDLPATEEENSKDLHGVVLEENLDVELGSESVVSVSEDKDKLDDQGDVGTVGLEVAVVGTLGLAVDTLSDTGTVVVDEGDVHDHESDETATSDNADQPAEDLGRAVGDLQEGEEWEEHGDAEAVDRNTALVAVSQELRGAAFKGKRVEGTGSTVGVCVAGGEDRCKDQEVDDVRKTLDAKVGHGNDIGRRSSVSSASGAEVDVNELRVVVSTADADSEGTDDEEDAESVVDGLEGALDGECRALSLSRDHRNVLGADDGEGGAEEGGEETLEAALIALAEVCSEGAGVGEVSETVGIVLGVTTTHSDEGEGEQEEDED
jgi:hypothetical protein